MNRFDRRTFLGVTPLAVSAAMQTFAALDPRAGVRQEAEHDRPGEEVAVRHLVARQKEKCFMAKNESDTEVNLFTSGNWPPC